MDVWLMSIGLTIIDIYQHDFFFWSYCYFGAFVVLISKSIFIKTKLNKLGSLETGEKAVFYADRWKNTFILQSTWFSVLFLTL
jgi:hypothetical protein